MPTVTCSRVNAETEEERAVKRTFGSAGSASVLTGQRSIPQRRARGVVVRGCALCDEASPAKTNAAAVTARMASRRIVRSQCCARGGRNQPGAQPPVRLRTRMDRDAIEISSLGPQDLT